MRYIFLIFLFIGFQACNKKMTSNSQANTPKVLYVDKAYEAFGVRQINFELNSSKEYVLATYQKEGIPGASLLQVAILGKENGTLIKKMSLNNGSAKWSGTYQIQIIAPPGITKGDDKTLKDYTYFIDARTGKEIKENSMSE